MRHLEAIARRPLDRPPVWLMRQAGRYLPEYRALREKVPFQEAIRDPETAAEITLQPMRRFGFDAAIVFADIMTPVEAMGVEMTFDPGPRLASPVQDAATLHPLSPDEDVPFVLETLRIVRRELPDDKALIGFAGAPFTLAAYIVEGGGSRDFLGVRTMAAADPERLTRLLDCLADSTADYLAAQLDAGANAVQLFDSWAGLQSVSQFRAFTLPAVERLLGRLGAGGPVTYFAPGAAHLLDDIDTLDVAMVGVDWRLPIEDAWGHIDGKAVQGNLDPAVLLAGPDATAAATRDVLARVDGRPGHVFNLGHGITPGTPIASVEALVETICAWGAR